MKENIFSIIRLVALSGFCAAVVLGQGNKTPTVSDGKLAAKPISADEKPIKSFKVTTAQADLKAVDVKIFAGLVKGLEVSGTSWDETKKILTVEVENKSTVSVSPKSLLSFSINYSYPKITG